MAHTHMDVTGGKTQELSWAPKAAGVTSVVSLCVRLHTHSADSAVRDCDQAPCAALAWVLPVSLLFSLCFCVLPRAVPTIQSQLWGLLEEVWPCPCPSRGTTNLTAS